MEVPKINGGRERREKGQRERKDPEGDTHEFQRQGRGERKEGRRERGKEEKKEIDQSQVHLTMSHDLLFFQALLPHLSEKKEEVKVGRKGWKGWLAGLDAEAGGDFGFFFLFGYFGEGRLSQSIETF